MARRKSTKTKSEERKTIQAQSQAPDYDGNAVEYYLEQVFSFVGANLKEVGLGTAALVVLVLGGAAYASWLDSKEEQALAAYEKLMKEPVMRAEGAEKAAVRKLKEHIKAYTGSQARMRAEGQLVGYLAKSGQHKQAGDLAVKLAGELDYPEQRSYYLLQAAVHYENGKQYAHAARNYELVGKLIKKENYPKAVALFGEARCLYRLGKRKEARNRIQAMMKMKTVNNIAGLQSEAAAFLLNFKAR